MQTLHYHVMESAIKSADGCLVALRQSDPEIDPDEASAEATESAPAGEGEGEQPSMLHLLLKLPQALTTAVLKRLDVCSAGRLSCVSREFCEATSDPEVQYLPPRS